MFAQFAVRKRAVRSRFEGGKEFDWESAQKVKERKLLFRHRPFHGAPSERYKSTSPWVM